MNKIKAGLNHSYIRTKCGQHLMFGMNGDNECIVFNDGEYVHVPTRIDLTLKQRFGVSILDLVPGRNNTVIVGVQ